MTIRSLLCLFILTLLLICNGACEVDTRVKIVDDHNPPKFKLSGNGTLITLFVYGPYPSLEGFKRSPFEIEPVWEVGVALPGVKIRDLNVISYGEIPAGFYQVFPKNRPPPALEEGKYYMVTPLSGNANWEALCFKPKGEKVEEVSCQSPASASADEHIRRGNSLHDGGDPAGAIAQFDQAIAINPKQPFYYFKRGNARQDRREFDLAILDYNKAISIDANIPDVYENRGLARMSKADWDGAISDFNMAITLNPNQVNAYNDRGYVRRQKGDIDGALADFEKAITLNPNDAYFYNNRGSVRRMKGDLDGGLVDVNKSIELDPKNAEAYCNRGLIYLSQKNNVAANLSLDKCYSLDVELKAKFEKLARETKK